MYLAMAFSTILKISYLPVITCEVLAIQANLVYCGVQLIKLVCGVCRKKVLAT
jgi:hypothetical protein